MLSEKAALGKPAEQLQLIVNSLESRVARGINIDARNIGAREKLLLRASVSAFVYIFGVNLFIVCPSLRSVPERVSRVYWHRPEQLVFMLFSDKKSKYGLRARKKTLSCFRDGDWRWGKQRKALWSQVFSWDSRLILILSKEEKKKKKKRLISLKFQIRSANSPKNVN